MNHSVKNLLAIFFIFSGYSNASIYDYLYPYQEPGFSSYGTIGIIQMPSARLLNEGTVAANFSQFDPYQRLSIVAYPFDWMEAIYQYTDIRNELYSPVFAFSGNQTYKDKGVDLKIRLLSETDTLPELAVGFRDFGGTGLFSSEFLVASKYYKNSDFTFGLGWGNLANADYKNPFSIISKDFDNREGFQELGGKGGEVSLSSFFRGKSVGIFAGYEYFLPNIKGLRLKVEYDSTDYEQEGFKAQPQDSKFNFGLTYGLNKNTKFYVGFIRGNQIQLGFSLSKNFGKKDVSISKKDKYKAVPLRDSMKKVTEDKKYLYLASLKYLGEAKIPLRTANVQGDTLQVSFAQNKYLSYPRAYGRALRVLDDISPESIKNFELTALNSRFELANIKVSRQDFNAYKAQEDFVFLNNSVELSQSYNSIQSHDYKPTVLLPKTFYQFGPNAQTHIGGADRFFVAGLHLSGQFETLVTRNLNIQGSIKIGVIDSFQVLEQGSDSVLPHVRTDLIEYLKEGSDFAISRLQFNYFGNPYQGLYTRLSGGLFEEMFGGIGGEVLYRPFSKIWAIGIEGYEVQQRDYDQQFSFREYKTQTGHITFYINEPRTKILTKIIGGKYLAGDSGITLDFSRRFKSGLRMGIFASITDISKEEFGEGSFDKGFYIDFPLEGFIKNHSRSLSTFGLRPVTRDGAARLLSGFDLYGVTDQGSMHNILKDLDDWYD
ncbi:YjbH domain-containing protein [Gammaproteobacteria bacterium]|nr:YjbH domain-containing protein [Gammaproteobacteria bacterium]MDB2677776.1 YjbH domain-containing protein [Gammaproteobacteria bacterium]MDC3228719.1 YjbH domain-containing protein [Gammaproteobacteria bacterium]